MNSANADFAAWSQAWLASIENALSDWVGEGAPAPLREGMRYAVLDGGKRLRALLVMATAEAVEGNEQAAVRAACAIELIHAYSLVHDDMPCMDNDLLRRGKPSTHVQFGEAGALLVGDGLQAQAFELLTPEASPEMPDAMQARLCRLLASAAGARGMVGGQAIDLASVGKQLTQDALQHMHALKTGALLQASVLMGAACGNAPAQAAAGLKEYASAIGLAYQVVDDILDVTADSQTLGKTAGKDAANDKPTYVSLLGLEPARAYARTLHAQASEGLLRTGLINTARMQALADFVINRAF